MNQGNNDFSLRHKAAFLFLSANYVISLLICLGFLWVTPGINNVKSFVFVWNAFFTNTFLLILILYLLFLPLLFIASKKTFYLVLLPMVTLFQIFLVTDLGIYNLCKFHINAFVINFFITPGSWDSVDLGIKTIASIAALLSLIIGAEWFLLQKSLKMAPASIHRKKSTASRIIIVLLVLMTLGDKFAFGFADIYNTVQITRFSKLFPLYQPFTFSKFAENVMGIEINREHSFDIDLKSSMLTYPLNPVSIPENGRTPNFIWIVIDGYRYDMLTSEVTPRILEFSNQAQLFTNHYSGGNATRFGIFSLFYGIYSYNWHQFVAERVSPVFMDTLIALGYDFNINSSTRLTYPEFRKTAFVKMPDAVNDAFEGRKSYERDISQIEAVQQWLDQKESTQPFFLFLFLDAPHSRNYPPEFEKFKTDSKSTNYLFVSDAEQLQAKFNWMNSLWFLDHKVGELLETVKRNDLLADTVILITGDHGEEFGEHGFFGHNHAFTPEQVQVPMIIYLPWRDAAAYDHMTSHNDVPATMLELLGVNTPASDYSNGSSMLGTPQRHSNLACSWNQCGYYSDGVYINFSMEPYNSGLFEIRDENYQLADLPRQRVQQVRQAVTLFAGHVGIVEEDGQREQRFGPMAFFQLCYSRTPRTIERANRADFVGVRDAGGRGRG